MKAASAHHAAKLEDTRRQQQQVQARAAEAAACQASLKDLAEKWGQRIVQVYKSIKHLSTPPLLCHGHVKVNLGHWHHRYSTRREKVVAGCGAANFMPSTKISKASRFAKAMPASRDTP